MANLTKTFKTYTRGQRQSTIETDYSMGVMFTTGTVDFSYVKMLVNYDMSNEGKVLIPRPGLRTEELILPDIVSENDPNNRTYHTSENIAIRNAKECTELDGKTYRQFILGQVDTGGVTGELWVSTSEKTEEYLNDLSTYSLKASVANTEIESQPCAYFTTLLKEIHGMSLVKDAQVATLIGTFAFGNSFYFINPTNKCLSKTAFDNDSKKYLCEDITPKTVDPSEAVTYGYNMLNGSEAYSFVNRSLSGEIQLTGILPYSTKEENILLMTPKKNEDIYFRCNFKGEVGKSYKFVWEWRTTDSSEWTSIVSLEKSDTYTIVADTGDLVKLKGSDGTIYDDLEITFKAPADDIMIRVQAFNSSDTSNVEKAMVVGFDFTVDTYGEATNVPQEYYDLTTATGMEYWKNRLVLWGVTKDPTILFVSDVNEPAYFPYPNNVAIYDEPIVCAKSFMDTLLVFTTSKVYQVTLSEDGTSWTSTVIQTNLNISPWDRHLIQIVRNMVFFKSGNYYFMIVPKSQSTTGELTLAPVSTPVVEFFNNFEKNVADLLKDTFNYEGVFSLVNYYNFLDYEDVHNIYVFSFNDTDSGKSGYLHLDLLYNTTTRAWRVHTFEAPHFLYAYKHDATQRGQLASTSLLNMVLDDSSQGTSVSIKKPEGKANATSVLMLAETGFDIDDVGDLRVKVYNPSGELYIDTVLDTWTLMDNSYIRVSNESYRLDTELLNTDIDFTLTASSEVFYYGSRVEITYNKNNRNLFTVEKTKPYNDCVYVYKFTMAVSTDSYIYYNGGLYKLDTYTGYRYKSSQTDAFYVEAVSAADYTYRIAFNEKVNSPTVRLINVTSGSELNSVEARCIQLYKFDSLNIPDFYVPEGVSFVYTVDQSEFALDTDSIVDSFQSILDRVDDLFLFKNWQFIDTGYRDIDLQVYKRFRELQLQLNNIEGVNLSFGMEFTLDGDKRISYYTYETEHVVDENDPNYGLLYVQATPYMNLELEYVATPEETALDTWVLNQSLFPDLTLWKVRAPISGKGSAPRLRLLSRNETRFELMNINWVYRIMNMR